MPETKRPLKVFLCHAKADKSAVRELYKRLTNDGLDAWLDAENLLPGQNWQVEIPKAIRDSDVVIVCLSENSINKEGYVQREIRFALDLADEKPEGTIFIIPARLEECETPERLSVYHWVDLFDETGYRRLMLAFNEKSKRSDVVFKLQKQYAVSTLSDETFVKKVSDELEKQEKEGNKLRLILKEFIAIVSRISKRFQSLFWGVSINHTRMAIIVALIGFMGIVIAGLLSLPLNTKWFHLGAAPTQTATTKIALTSTLTLTPSLPSPTPTKTRAPSPTATLGVGSTMISDRDGMIMMYVPTGEFTMGINDENSELDSSNPAHKVNLNAFWIDQTEVTNAMFEKFIASANYETDAQKKGYSFVYRRDSYPWGWIEAGGADWQHPSGLNSNIASKGNHPVVQVSRNDAIAYCKWRGDRLPTEAEWEKAARGTDERKFPWGNNNLKLSYQGSNENTTSIKTYPESISPYKLYDMAGNVMEWVNDWYDESYYISSPSSNPLGPDSGSYAVLRGGSWILYGNYRATYFRFRYYPGDSNYSIGFRCAKSVP